MAITKDVMMGKTPRKSFAKQDQILELPNMLKIQKDSYEWFLREGLREVFRDVDTITDYTGNLELSFLDYSMNEPPKYSVEECKERDATYAKPIKVRVRLHNKETDEIKEQEIFMGDFPLIRQTALEDRQPVAETNDDVAPEVLLCLEEQTVRVFGRMLRRESS